MVECGILVYNLIFTIVNFPHKNFGLHPHLTEIRLGGFYINPISAGQLRGFRRPPKS